MKYVTLLTLLFLSFSFANESAYTSIAEKDCKVKEVYEMNMGASVRCEKFEQFSVEVNDEDARMSITISHRGIMYPQCYASAVSPLFSSLGKKIEWRHHKGESYAPYAFIVRFDVSIENEDSPSGFKSRSNLVVSKIDKLSVCVVGVIPPQKNQNILARELADKATTMPCLVEEQNHSEDALKKVLSLQAELESKAKTQKEFYYMRDMGPLEHTLRVLQTPSFPIWRMRLRLYPVFSDKFPSQLGGYRVVTDRINLSYMLHDNLIEQYGRKNVDPTLKNTDLSETYSFEYMMMRTPATFLEESVDLQHDVNLEDTCGSQRSCNKLYEADNGDWGKGSIVKLEKSPWSKEIDTLPSMVRALANKAGWIKHNGPLITEWTPQEILEGMNAQTPWIEIIIENHAGNGGYLMEWHELVSDDSIVKTLYRIAYDNTTQETETTLYSAVLCRRGQYTNKPTQICP